MYIFLPLENETALRNNPINLKAGRIWERNPLGPIYLWTTRRRAKLVLQILKGGTSVPESARRHMLTVAEVESWQE